MALGSLLPPTPPLPPVNTGENTPVSMIDQEKGKLSDEAKAALKTICSELETADKPSWTSMVKEFKRLTYFWHGIHHLFWNETAKDWRTPEQAISERPDLDIDPDDYRKIVQIYKAHGESIIAALSASLPSVAFFPKDADNPDDIMSAKGHSKVSDLIQKQNEAPLAFIQAMYTVFNCGIVAAYNYHNTSDEYGTVRNPIYGTEINNEQGFSCPTCQAPLTGDEPINGDGSVTCDTCGDGVNPETSFTLNEVPTITGYDEEDKGREIIEIWGPLNIKLPPYIRKLRDAPYLCLITEHHYSKMMELYPEIKDEIKGTSDNSDRWIRDSPYNNKVNDSLVSVKRWWLRPFTFNMVKNEGVQKELRANFPSGVYWVQIEDKFAEAIDENMDDYWTITENPMAETVFSDPIGQPLASIQEMTDNLVSLTEQTIEYGIGETFADPDVLSFDQYGTAENAPGMIFPAKSQPGKKLEDGFFSMKTASLSKEVNEFSDFLKEMGQFVTGDFPSVFGGFAEGGSRTLGEYQSSQSRALQRLSLPWKVIGSWWSKVIKKAVKSFKKHMKDDELMVVKQGNSFVNVWIRKEELENGQIGEVYSESSDQLPVSWSQRRDLLMQLIQLNNPEINSAVFSPDNVGEVSQTLGFTDLTIPGDNDRNKQLYEIGESLKGQPMGNEPSVPVEPMVDNHAVHIEVSKNWLVSPAGIEAKQTNPMGYQNVLAHLMRHIFTQISMMPPSLPGGPNNGPPGEGKPTNAPITSNPNAVKPVTKGSN